MEGKRTYIRRKKCLNEIVSTIKSTLKYISDHNRKEIGPLQIDQLALQHSTAIEAACWFPKQHMTEKEYSNLLMGKAKLLCQALMKQKLPGSNLNQVPGISSQPQSDPEILDRPINESNMLSTSPMTKEELSDFITQGKFSFSSISPNTIPPLKERNQKSFDNHQNLFIKEINLNY